MSKLQHVAEAQARTPAKYGALDDPVKMYFKQMGQAPLLTREQEVEISKRIETAESKAIMMNDCSERHQHWMHEAQRAKTEMVEANLRLVISIAKKYMNRGLPFLDLIQEGNMGLMKAVRKFEYRRGYKFSTYATWWIRQAITSSIADQSRTIRIPVHVLEMITKLRRVEKQLVQEYGYEPTTEEIAAEVHLPAHRVRSVLRMAQQTISLEAPVGGSNTTFGDFIEGQVAEDITEGNEAFHLRDTIQDVMNTLTDREREIIVQRSGLIDGRSRTLEEVGVQFEVTRERIRQIEAKALRKMRAVMPH